MSNGKSSGPDEMIALLRRFYSAFGMPDEGPPADFDASVLPSTFVVSEVELQTLNTVLNDSVARRQFLVCREILDDLATRLQSEELLRELSQSLPVTEEAFENLVNGVFWFSLAASLDRRHDGLPVMPFEANLELPLPVKVRLTVVGSLVMRLYMALVLVREGVLSSLISQGSQAGRPCCGRVKKLLNSDYVRRIRNSLSHGSFSMTIAGVAFRDDNGVIAATPGFLKWLCTWLMLIQLQALSAVRKQ
jgi:hypothetical protein